MQKIISIAPSITEKRSFKNLKIFSSSVPFLSVKYFDKRLLFPKIWHIWVKYCWNYGPSNLLFRFTRHTLQRPKNRERKMAINSLIYLFESYYLKKCLVKVSNFLTYWLKSDGPLKFLWNWMEKTFIGNFWQVQKWSKLSFNCNALFRLKVCC